MALIIALLTGLAIGAAAETVPETYEVQPLVNDTLQPYLGLLTTQPPVGHDASLADVTSPLDPVVEELRSTESSEEVRVSDYRLPPVSDESEPQEAPKPDPREGDQAPRYDCKMADDGVASCASQVDPRQPEKPPTPPVNTLDPTIPDLHPDPEFETPEGEDDKPEDEPISHPEAEEPPAGTEGDPQARALLADEPQGDPTYNPRPINEPVEEEQAAPLQPHSRGPAPDSSPPAILGAVAVIAAAGAVTGILWGPIGLLPFFSRIVRGDLLEHPLRRRIHELVEANPGIHLEELIAETGMVRGQLQHHVRKLEGACLLRQVNMGGFVCLFLPNAVPVGQQRQIVRALKSTHARRVLTALSERPGSSVRALSQVIGINAKAVRYHAKVLEAAGLVEQLPQEGKIRFAATAAGCDALAEPLAVHARPYRNARAAVPA